MKRFPAVSLVLLCCLLMAGASAAELKVLTAGAFKPVVSALAPAFEQRTGHKVVLDNATAGVLAKRISDGEAFDVAIITPAVVKELSDSGKLQADSVANVARVGIGVAVKAGAPQPDIGSASAFQQALLAARAVAFIDPASGGSSGIYLARLFDRMGIAAQIKSKSVLVPGGLVAQRLVTGEADIAIHQISEILAVPGVTLVGPLPAELQNYTVYAGALSTKAANAAGAKEFLALLRSAEAAAILKAKGMEAP
ncbi:MAG: extracellular solute-binding protein [Betaproteobacteria bacterium]